MDELGLGASLRSFRGMRGLSLGRAAAFANVSKGALSGWENANGRPRGPALARLLRILEVEPRLQARLLQEADPSYARVALKVTSLGAPVDVGQVIRAMRGRRGATQSDLARGAGVSQAAVARWESGDDMPKVEALRRACRALGANADELMALACARGESMAAMPNRPEAAQDYVESLRNGHLQTDEIVSLALEAELWRRSIRDARWDPL